jgi:hypothetical protein
VNAIKRWKRLLGCIFVVIVIAPDFAKAGFVPGDVLYVEFNSVYNIRNGGNFSSAKPLAPLPSTSLGQIAFDSDLQAAYVSQTELGEILKITSSGTVSVFAQVPHGNFGMIRLKDGRLLATIGGGRVADISAGGDLTAVTPFATGLGFTRDFLETSDGRILIASQDTGKVFDITHGGDFSKAIPFASGLGVNADLAQDSNGRIFVSQFNLQRVTDITNGGDFTTATPFATGQSFMGLTIDGQGRLLASIIGPVGTSASVYDISAGGDFRFAAPFASGLPAGETNIDTAVPEPSIGLLGGLAVIGALRVRRTDRK